MTAQLVHHSSKALGYKQLGRVGRQGTDTEQRKIVSDRLNIFGHVVGLAVEESRHAAVVFAKSLGEGCLSKVKVKYKGPGTLECHRSGHIKDAESLAGIGIERSNHNHLATGTVPQHKVQVGAKHAEGLVDGVTLAALYQYVAVFVVEAVDAGTLEYIAFDSKLGYFCKERHRQILHIAAVLDSCVHQVTDVENGKRYCKTQEQGGQQHLHTPGSNRRVTAGRSHNQAGILYIDKSLELVLFSLLEQEYIKLFLNLLLTLLGLQIKRLSAGCRNAVQHLLLLAGGLVGLQLQRADEVIHRADDRALELVQGGIEVNDYGVVLRGVGKQPVALEQQLVILAYLGLNGGVLYAYVGRYQRAVVGRVGKIVANIFGHRQLVVYLERTACILRRLAQIGSGDRRCIGQSVGLAEFLDVALDTTQFLFYDCQSLFYEFTCVGR